MANEKVYKKLIDKYGDKQVVVAIEELSELQKELCKALRGKPQKEQIIEEMADALIMIEQMKIYFDIDEEYLEHVKNTKISRTKSRLLNKQ